MARPGLGVRLGRRTIAAIGVLASCLLLPCAPSHADAILMWNNALLDAIRQTSPLLVDGPPEVAREIAMVDTAMFDAVNAATGMQYHPYAYTGSAVAGASADAAALSAGYQVLTSIFSSPLWQMPPPAGNATVVNGILSNINTAYSTALAGLGGGSAVTAGVALGQTAAAAMIAKRAGDGSAPAIVNGLTPQAPPGSGTVPGVYIPPSASGGRPEMFPQWGSVTPFGTPGSTLAGYENTLPIHQVLSQPGGLATLINSPGYANVVLQTACVGSATPLTGGLASACSAAGFAPQTAAQQRAALFWNDPGGTVQPPGHWLEIADALAGSRGLTEVQEARLSALLGIVEADSAVGAWNIKYLDNLWRPITAIRDCGGWSSFFTTCDPSWTSTIATPPHPDYIAGHPTFSEAAAVVLRDFFGTDAVPFCSTSDAYVNGSTPVAPIAECFSSFSAASTGPDGAALSRIFGGIHTLYAVNDGTTLGGLIGAYDFGNVLQPVPEPPGTMLLASGAAMLLVAGWRRKRRS